MTVVHAMLSNAAVAAGLALVALAVGRAGASPALRHAAWLVVLLKLVTPPLFAVPLPVLPASWAEEAAESSVGRVVLYPPAVSTAASPVDVAMGGPALWARLRPQGPAGWAVAAWGVGASAWFAWQGRRVLRFRRRVARADDAPPEVKAAAVRIAASLGIARVPAVKVVTGIGSPMLWGWGGGAAVLFPRDLLDRLSPEARDTLVAHELVHFMRRDHWVRVLEFVATGLYWWHPAVWLARAGVEAAEEECCDAWVVGGLAASPRGYAEALLATVDYEAELRRPRLPPGACAANRGARLLRRRLTALIHADRAPRLRGAVLIWIAVAAVLLVRPVLCAATAECAEAPAAPVAGESVRKAPQAPPPRKSPAKVPREPRSWAATAAPGGGPAVFARDKEIVLRLADGTQKALGPGRPLAVAFAPGGARLATVGPGDLLRTWDARGQLVATTRTSAAGRALTYTPDGARLLVLDAAGEVTVRDPRTLDPVANWYVEGAANSIACSPDGRTAAVSLGSWLTETGSVELWSVADRKKVASYPASAPVGATRFSPDGRTLVIGGWNGLVAWRSLPGGELVAERQLTKGLVASAAFSPDAELPLVPPPEPAPPPTVVEWPPAPVGFPPR